MHAQIEKPKENNSRAVAHSVGQKKGNTKQVLGFVDNRPEAKSQRTLQLKIHGDINAHQPVNHPTVHRLIQREVNQSQATQFLLQRVAQLMDAGSGGQWHIHHEHIKLGNNVDSRVNFNGRSKKDIRKELGEKIDRYGLNVGGNLAASFRECIDYINAHY